MDHMLKILDLLSKTADGFRDCLVFCSCHIKHISVKKYSVFLCKTQDKNIFCNNVKVQPQFTVHLKCKKLKNKSCNTPDVFCGTRCFGTSKPHWK